VYEESSGNLFVHHDIPLPSYPLCLAHGTINSDGQAGNYVAVGSFHPGIEIWNLDILDVLEPECILGGEDTTHLDDEWKNLALGIKPKKGKNTLPNRSSKGPTLRRGSHKDAVMSLSWNPIHRQVIASGSADKTVKLWDITQQSSMDDESNKMNGPYTTWTHHKDKVQSLAWHPTEGTILASGSYDRSVCVIDARTQDGSVCKRAKIPADCEAIAWDPHHPHLLTAASEDGTVLCWDVRNFGKNHYWSFVAHEFGGCSDISYNAKIPGMLASCAIDKTVAIWDTMNIASGTNSPSKPISCGLKRYNSIENNVRSHESSNRDKLCYSRGCNVEVELVVIYRIAMIKIETW
jgi:periodic tryptophan protein 1